MEAIQVYGYSRKEAIEDGVLVDAAPLAEEAGLRFPTALTQAVYEKYVRVPEGVRGQDETGRLWDILWMLRAALCTNEDLGDRVSFAVHVRNNNRHGTPPLVNLIAHVGPGDEMEPVITIMLPDED